MSILATSASSFLVGEAAGKGLFSRLLTAIMRARAVEAERIVGGMMERRGLRLVNGEWKPATA